jgi:hypothetical protein
LEVKLNKLAQVIAGCWVEGESRLAELIAAKHPNASEELITDLLAGELRSSIAQASDTHRIEHAFLGDLDSEIPDFSFTDARRFGGLVATVTPHTKSHEGRVSAADLGIVILRPQVWLNGLGTRPSNAVEIMQMDFWRKLSWGTTRSAEKDTVGILSRRTKKICFQCAATTIPCCWTA